jgi:hypothetical protein
MAIARPSFVRVAHTALLGEGLSPIPFARRFHRTGNDCPAMNLLFGNDVWQIQIKHCQHGSHKLITIIE